MTTWSLRRRLTNRIVTLVTIFWISASCFAGYIFYEEVSEVLDSSLEETAHRIVPLVEALKFVRDKDQRLRSVQVETEGYAHEEYVTYQIRDATGKVLIRSYEAPDYEWKLPDHNGFSNDGFWRLYTIHLKSQKLIVQVGENIEHRFVAISEAVFLMFLPLILILPVFFLFFRHTLNAAFVPVLSFSREIDRRDPNNLDRINSSDLPDEFQTVSSKLNDLLARVRKALEAERTFSGNSAHQMRTPVAAALAQSEMLERELSHTGQAERVKKLSDALRRLGRVVEKLLQLARADSEADTRSGTTPIGDIIQLLIADYQRLAPNRLFLVSGLENMSDVKVDADSFGIIFQNLIENANAYATAMTPIEIEVTSDRHLCVRNDCEPLSADLIKILTERFVRGDTQSQGSGLGLAIVKSLARQMNIQFAIFSPIRGKTRGFEVELVFGRGSKGA